MADTIKPNSERGFGEEKNPARWPRFTPLSSMRIRPATYLFSARAHSRRVPSQNCHYVPGGLRPSPRSGRTDMSIEHAAVTGFSSARSGMRAVGAHAAPNGANRSRWGQCYKHDGPKCSLRSLTYLQVQVLPRQWMVGPSSHSRPGLGETPAGASSAVNGWACRRRKRRQGRVSRPNQHAGRNITRRLPSRNTCPPMKPVGRGVLEQPNRVRTGEGSYGRGMNHQVNPVSQRDRGRSMHEQYGKEKKGR
jgi:hypothetical protein